MIKKRYIDVKQLIVFVKLVRYLHLKFRAVKKILNKEENSQLKVPPKTPRHTMQRKNVVSVVSAVFP